MEKPNKGFTIIELLVVIGIIATLATVVIPAISRYSIEGKNIRRTADVSQISKALMMYYEDHGKFPCHSFQNSTESDFLLPLVTEGYIGNIPEAPDNDNYPYEYQSFRTSLNPGTPCGQLAYLGMYTEGEAVCPSGGSYSGSHEHCHIFIPTPIPPPCENPYNLDGVSPSCNDYGDTTDEW